VFQFEDVVRVVKWFLDALEAHTLDAGEHNVTLARTSSCNNMGVSTACLSGREESYRTLKYEVSCAISA
jgi:hypothetical protein